MFTLGVLLQIPLKFSSLFDQNGRDEEPSKLLAMLGNSRDSPNIIGDFPTSSGIGA